MLLICAHLTLLLVASNVTRVLHFRLKSTFSYSVSSISGLQNKVNFPHDQKAHRSMRGLMPISNFCPVVLHFPAKLRPTTHQALRTVRRGLQSDGSAVRDENASTVSRESPFFFWRICETVRLGRIICEELFFKLVIRVVVVCSVNFAQVLIAKKTRQVLFEVKHEKHTKNCFSKCVTANKCPIVFAVFLDT